MTCKNCGAKLEKVFERSYLFFDEVVYKCPKCNSRIRKKVKKIRNSGKIFNGNYKVGKMLNRL